MIYLSALLWSVTSPSFAQAAENSFETKLGLTPVPDGAKPNIAGTGSVTATLDGQTLKVESQFSGVNGNATDAHLMKGPGIGMPGLVMSDLALGSDRHSISASVKLSREQVAALRAGQVYVQINSDKSPAPAGHLWGWLLPTHPKAAEDEPQQGQWFLPQGLGLKSPTRSHL